MNAQATVGGFPNLRSGELGIIANFGRQGKPVAPGQAEATGLPASFVMWINAG
jgi:hypothetical protein